MIITEFLLARIAEKEESASAYHRVLCMRTACDADGCIWGAGEQEAMERERVCNCGHPARVRAECEAQRRIIERCRPRYAVLYRESERLLAEAFDQATMQTIGHSGPIWPHDRAEDTLRDLASVFADHPDFQDEWRTT